MVGGTLARSRWWGGTPARSVHTCGGYPVPSLGWGTPSQVWMVGGTPSKGWMVRGVPHPRAGWWWGGYPSQVWMVGGTLARSRWLRGTPARSGWWRGYLGYPPLDRAVQQTLAMWLVVSLLRSCKRTFLFQSVHTCGGGVPHLRSGVGSTPARSGWWGGTPSQIWGGGVPHPRGGGGTLAQSRWWGGTPSQGWGVPRPGLDGGGYPHPRSGGYPSQVWMVGGTQGTPWPGLDGGGGCTWYTPPVRSRLGGTPSQGWGVPQSGLDGGGYSGYPPS